MKQRPDIIEHFALTVRDVTESVAWYVTNFRCEVDYQDDTFARLQFRNVILSFVVPAQHPSHMAVLREDAEQFGQLIVHRDGTRSVSYLYDPSGNAVEIQSSLFPAKRPSAKWLRTVKALLAAGILAIASTPASAQGYLQSGIMGFYGGLGGTLGSICCGPPGAVIGSTGGAMVGNGVYNGFYQGRTLWNTPPPPAQYYPMYQQPAYRIYGSTPYMMGRRY